MFLLNLKKRIIKDNIYNNYIIFKIIIIFKYKLKKYHIILKIKNIYRFSYSKYIGGYIKIYFLYNIIFLKQKRKYIYKIVIINSDDNDS